MAKLEEIKKKVKEKIAFATKCRKQCYIQLKAEKKEYAQSRQLRLISKIQASRVNIWLWEERIKALREVLRLIGQN